VLRATQGGKTKAAEILGISRKTLWEKINAYGINK
jgi:DNA-binding NtrC family response regulator